MLVLFTNCFGYCYSSDNQRKGDYDMPLPVEIAPVSPTFDKSQYSTAEDFNQNNSNNSQPVHIQLHKRQSKGVTPSSANLRPSNEYSRPSCADPRPGRAAHPSNISVVTSLDHHLPSNRPKDQFQTVECDTRGNINFLHAARSKLRPPPQQRFIPPTGNYVNIY